MNMITKTSNYSIAVIEYAGMVSFSYMKRSGLALKFGMEKMVPPVKRVTTSPFIYCGQKIGNLSKVFKRKDVIEERLIAIDEKLDRIAIRLADIEKAGVYVAEKQKPVKEKKQLNEGKKMLLKAIVSENLQVRHHQEGLE